MKHEILSKTDLYINGRYYTTLDKVVLCTKDQAPSDLPVSDEGSETIVAIYKEEIPDDVETKGPKLNRFFREMQEKKLKIFKDKDDGNKKVPQYTR
jgi:hypothetical protein